MHWCVSLNPLCEKTKKRKTLQKVQCQKFSIDTSTCIFMYVSVGRMSRSIVIYGKIFTTVLRFVLCFQNSILKIRYFKNLLKFFGLSLVSLITMLMRLG